MKNLRLPFTTPRRLPFYLAMEEWCARSLEAGEYFFAWRVAPTVICGRNQDMIREVDMNYCHENAIDVVRRKSGGGCVYADMDNFMFSYICPGDEISSTFARYTTMIASVLNDMGLEACATGRNDIMVGGRKISGNAFYHLPGRCIVHGTMLYDFDPAVMSHAITPSRAKLESKAVKSVPMRVTCARNEGINLSHNEFEKAFIESLCDDSILLDDKAVSEIEQIEQTYYAPTFLYRKGIDEPTENNKANLFTVSENINGVGEIEIKLDCTAGRIRSMELTGDYFLIGDSTKYICEPLVGTPLKLNDIEKAVGSTRPEKAISGLDRASLLNLLIKLPLNNNHGI